MEERDYLREAYEALKRADHLYYVSLKYARTVDVMRTILERIEDALTNLLLAVLQHEVEQGRREAFPEAKPEQARAILQLAEDARYKRIVEQRMLLRRMLRAPFDREREFRKAVTMIIHLGREDVRLTIEAMKELIDMAKAFFQDVYEGLRGVQEDFRFF